MKLNIIRKQLYKEVYLKHANKSKIAKEMNRQPIYRWRDNPYLKLKYYLIIEFSAMISFICLRLNIHPNFITTAGVFSAFLSFIFLSSPFVHLNLIALIIFFLKNIFDYADGFVARISKKYSEFGAFYDEWSGDFFTVCFYFSFPIYVYNFTNNLNYLYLLIFLSFMKLVNPKSRILSNNYLNKVNISSRKKIIKIFEIIHNLRKKKKMLGLKNTIILVFSKFDFDGRTQYTDFLIYLVLFEISYGEIILSNYICIMWLLISILKNIYFFKKLNILKSKR